MERKLAFLYMSSEIKGATTLFKDDTNLNQTAFVER